MRNGRLQLIGPIILALAACSSGPAAGRIDAATAAADGAAAFDAPPVADATTDATAAGDASSRDGAPSGDAGAADASPCATDCSQLDGACTVGVCSAQTDTCVAKPANEGASCDDGNPCRSGDTCTSGACSGGTLTCAVPSAVTTGTASASTMIGSAAQTIDSACPSGQVLVGVYGSHYPSRSQPTLFEWFQSAGAICAPLQWVWDAASAEYQTRDGTTTDLAEVGQHYPLAAWRSQCADGSVITGVDAVVYSGTLTKMTFKCAPITATYMASNWVLAVGASTSLSSVGLGVGTGVSSNCPAGDIATGLRLGANSGATSATGISFLCAVPSLVVSQ